MTTEKSAVLFPGQGSQEKGMGRALAEKDSQAMDIWKKAEKISGYPLREIFWDGDQEDISLTNYLQPALTVVSLNLWFFFKDKLQIQIVGGHSLGEYCALCSSRVLDVEQTLKLVSLRGRLMAESGKHSHGAMAAVLKLEQEVVEEITEKTARQTGKIIIVANYNTPGQFVVSGHLEAVKALGALVDEAGGRLVMLPVSGAFHSPLMDEAARELARMMEKTYWRTPDCDVFFNSTAKSERDPEKIKKLMQRQMTSPVYFIQQIQNMKKSHVNQFIEMGPKGVLSRMLPQILDSSEDFSVINISSSDDEGKLKTTKE